jgi:hypothetical protein
METKSGKVKTKTLERSQLRFYRGEVRNVRRSTRANANGVVRSVKYPVWILVAEPACSYFAT